MEVKNALVENEYENFYRIAKTYKTIMPNVVGLPAMDALALLENMQVNVNVKLQGNGVVKQQSTKEGIKLSSNQTIVLTAS